MKKLTALLSIALCLVIGGVYASWIYAGTTVTTPGTVAQSITIEDKVEQGNAGAIARHETANPLVLTADNKGGDDSASDDYYTVEFNHSGEIIFSFTPAKGAAAQYINGIPMQMTLTVSKATYTGGSSPVSVLRIKDDYRDTTDTDSGRTRIVLNTPAVGSTVNTLNTEKQLGSYTKVEATDSVPMHYDWKITSEQLVSLFVFCDEQTIILDTAHKHSLFQGNLNNSGINMMVEAKLS